MRYLTWRDIAFDLHKRGVSMIVGIRARSGSLIDCRSTLPCAGRQRRGAAVVVGRDDVMEREGLAMSPTADHLKSP